MKTTLLLIIACLMSYSIVSDISYAATTVTVTEYIPGAGCEGPKNEDVKVGTGSNAKSFTRTTYTCTIESGFGMVVNMMGAIIKYFTFIAGLCGVLFIILNGIMYSMSGIDAGMKDEAKKRIVATLMGLIVLLLSGVILNIVAPWIYR